MDAIGQVWNSTLVRPLAEALVFLALLTGSSGWAIILFTIGVKVVLLPLTWKQIQSQKAMMVIQPHIRAAQKKYGKDRQRLSEETMRIYRENNVNPASGCLPLVVQMPIWFALYQALINLGNDEEWRQSFGLGPDGPFQEGFWWLPNLAQPDPYYILPVLTAVTQYLIQRMMTPPTVDPQQQQMNRMMQLMPIMFLIFSLQFPAGLVLYWVTSNVVSFVQQYFLTGWGELFLHGYKPRTPFAGSWEPRGSRPAPPPPEDDEPPPVGARPRPRATDPNGRVSPRSRKEKRRRAKR